MPHPENPLIVQSDSTVLLEVSHPRYIAARDALARFAELEKSPEYIHSYRITPLSLWNAAASGLSDRDIIGPLAEFAKYDLPRNVVREISEQMGRYGRVRLERSGDDLLLVGDDEPLMVEIAGHPEIQPLITARLGPSRLKIDPAGRGRIKQELVRIGYPAEDLAGYVTGEPLAFSLRDRTLDGEPFLLRAYQREAGEIFYAGGSTRGGSGTIVLPCGAGKTIVGMAAMAQLQCSTLILTPNTVAVRQWIDELLDKTTLEPDEIGEYSGLLKETRPVTVSTYQIMTYHDRRAATPSGEFPHFELFNARNWGLILYDEVHLLPAPVFRITADLQARRRLGLTATLVREDGRESDVFSLIGPKKYDVPWKDLEKQGSICTALCHEVRISLSDADRRTYAISTPREKPGIAARNSRKLEVLRLLLDRHEDDRVLIIGTYLDQLERVASDLSIPAITGKTPVRDRTFLFDRFRSGEISKLALSKVGNFSIDLPDANVAIELSGTFGSRQEEAQRLGRILRPKRNGGQASFYALVTRDTVDQTFAANRQRFLTEQGYAYKILYEDEVLESPS